MLVKFAVKEDVISDKNKIIIKSNTTVNGRITRVKKLLGQARKDRLIFRLIL